jgi:predicted branched-subunit amino acid permease
MAATGIGAAVRRGLADGFGLPLIVIFGAMMGFGSVAASSGFGLGDSVLATLLVWAGPGQVVMADLRAAGADLLPLLLAVSMASVRFLPMTMMMMPVLRGGFRARGLGALFAQLISINVWLFTMKARERFSGTALLAYFLAVSAACLTVGVAGTVIGHVMTAVFPPVVAVAVLFLNVTFMALMIANTRDRTIAVAVVAGAVLGPLLHFASADYGILGAGLVGGTAAYLATRRRKQRR